MGSEDRATSLLAGRNAKPLTDDEIRRAANVFLGLDDRVNARFAAESRTVFRVAETPEGERYGEIVFGPDIYPGEGIADPNSALSLGAAAAHELTHYYRWNDKLALPEDDLEQLDEALTSLQAIQRYDRDLNDTDVRQLVADAIQRIQMFAQAYRDRANDPEPRDD